MPYRRPIRQQIVALLVTCCSTFGGLWGTERAAKVIINTFFYWMRDPIVPAMILGALGLVTTGIIAGLGSGSVDSNRGGLYVLLAAGSALLFTLPTSRFTDMSLTPFYIGSLVYALIVALGAGLGRKLSSRQTDKQTELSPKG